MVCWVIPIAIQMMRKFGQPISFFTDDELEVLPHHLLICRSLIKMMENIQAMTSDYFYMDVLIAPDYMDYEFCLNTLDPEFTAEMFTGIFNRLLGDHVQHLQQVTDGKFRRARVSMIYLGEEISDQDLKKDLGQLRTFYCQSLPSKKH